MPTTSKTKESGATSSGKALTPYQKKLISIFEEMFQFDRADLDFGIYRIMRMKHDQISDFLRKKLPEQITKELEALPDSGAAIEADIYNHLTNFFSRYYDEGDFISQRRYKDGAYAIPYEGEEVKLHWANADQYYVKSSEYFKDYTFKTDTGESVHFKLGEAQTEQDNVKASEKRFFQLRTDKPFEVIGDALYIHVEYKGADKKNQNACIDEIIEEFKKVAAQPEYQPFSAILSITDKKTLLERQLNRYTARNTFDYFIHKDLEKFLRRELDFYIKNDVIYLDDIELQDDAKTREYLTKAKVIRKIARKIITFLAQIENFQKKLWLKKKFVVETNYCITLDRVPETLYPEIAANAEQRKEWVRLFAIDEIKGEHGDLVSSGTLGYSEPLTKEFLKQNPHLVLDTQFFSTEFKERLIGSLNHFDEQCDGLLIHSENFQALNLLQRRYREQVKCVYIDPPYNTEKDREKGKFLYKDSYASSSWLSLMVDRIWSVTTLMNFESVFFSSIGIEELANLKNICTICFSENNFIEVFSWVKTSTPPSLSLKSRKTNEYIVCYEKYKSDIKYKGESLLGGDQPLLNRCNSIRELKFPKELVLFNKKYFPDGTKILPSQIDRVVLKNEITIVDGYSNTDIILEGEFKWTQEFLNNEISKGTTFVIKSDQFSIRFIRIDDDDSYKRPKNLIKHEDYSFLIEKENAGAGTNEDATKEIESLFACNVFDNPKPSSLISYIIDFINNKYSLILDYFAGSGTTGHAVINLNREDEGKRKYILVEMGDYFDAVLKSRIAKVVYSKAWKEGKPVSRDTGISHCFKYLRLESYEDALNNIEFRERDFRLPSGVQEEYLLSYMLETEAAGSACLLNVENLDKPFSYAINITRNLESQKRSIDLVETFNYLVGLRVRKSHALVSFDADFTTGPYGALSAKLVPGGRYKFKAVEGTLPNGEETLVIWREMTDDAEKDNATLDAYFLSLMNGRSFEQIYVNCDNNLLNLRGEDENWCVELIDVEMKKRMFEEAE